MAKADRFALLRERNILRTDIDELLACAYKYDDKPHQLFSFIRLLAERYESDPSRRAEIMGLMDYAYEHRGAPPPVVK